MPVPVRSEKMKQKQEERVSEGSYQLNLSNDEGFSNRVDSIFGGLDSLEQQHSEAVKNFETLNNEDSKDDDVESDETCSSSSGSSKEKDIEKPKCDLRDKLKRRQSPDFVSSPGKWKKYSLKDDGTSSFSKDISADQLNTQVAMEFMEKLKKTKTNNDTLDVGDIVVFKVPDLPNRSAMSDKSKNKSVFGSSHAHSHARCMETYEFGQNVKTKKQRVNKSSSDSELPTQEVVLHYRQSEEVDNLENEDDEDDDDNSKQENGGEENNEGSQNSSSMFISRGKKKNRVIRRQTSEDDDDE